MGTSTPSAALTSGHLLARNTVWNLIGQATPMIAAVLAIPVLIHAIGLERYGLLTLGWMVIGYFSVFDLGLGRALTKLISDRIGTRTEHEIPPLVWSSLLLILLLSVVGGCVLALLTPWLVHVRLKIPAGLQAETRQVFFLLAACVPVVTITSGLRGVLEAQQRFGILNTIRIPLGIFTFAGPLLVLPFSRSLVAIVLLLIAGRVVACFVHLVVCLRCFPALRHNFRIQRNSVFPALHLGAWMSVSNIISPLMVSVDRFLIGAAVSVTAVAYYTAPFDFVTKFTILPTALVSVLFPAFAMTLVDDGERTSRLLMRGLKYTFLTMYPLILAVIAIAPEGLRLWLGDNIALHSTTVLRWLAIGVFMNCLALVPLTLIQAAGRPDITAKLHIIEFPLYMVGVWWMIRAHGINGAALAWTVRVFLDAMLLFIFAHRIVPVAIGTRIKASLGAMFALLTFYVATLPPALLFRAALACAIALVFAASTWLVFLAPEERSLLLRSRQSGAVE